LQGLAQIVTRCGEKTRFRKASLQSFIARAPQVLLHTGAAGFPRLRSLRHAIESFTESSERRLATQTNPYPVVALTPASRGVIEHIEFALANAPS
jgi:hypothetical protein